MVQTITSKLVVSVTGLKICINLQVREFSIHTWQGPLLFILTMKSEKLYTFQLAGEEKPIRALHTVEF